MFNPENRTGEPVHPNKPNPNKPNFNMVMLGCSSSTRGLHRFRGLGPNPNRTEPMPTPNWYNSKKL
jgi:hypothetical protein